MVGAWEKEGKRQMLGHETRPIQRDYKRGRKGEVLGSEGDGVLCGLR